MTASFAPTPANKQSDFDTMRCTATLSGGHGEPTPAELHGLVKVEVEHIDQAV